MASMTMTSKGQVTIPVRVRKALRLKAGDRIAFVETDEGELKLIPLTRSVRELKGMFEDKQRQPTPIEEMNSAIARLAANSQ